MISTHVLDTSKGLAAAGIAVQLEKLNINVWEKVESMKTDSDGRIRFNSQSEVASYRLVFQVDGYFKSQGIASFFSEIPVQFVVDEKTRKYHVPLLLNPFGYSVYRGS